MARGSRRSRQSRYSTSWVIFSLLTIAALIIGLVATLTPSTGSNQPQSETAPPPVLPSPILPTVALSPTQLLAGTATPTATMTPPGIPLPPTLPSP